MKAHCLFEQAGTFKNEFIKLGVPCEDYDILNDFGETENKVDLFQAIRDCYEGKQSILDRISMGDIVMAFFPCTRFEAQIILSMRGENCGMKGWTDEQKLEYSMILQRELAEYFELVSKLVIIAIRGGWIGIFELKKAANEEPKKERRVDYDAALTEYYIRTNGGTG